MYMKSLVSLAVLGAMSAVATAGDLVVFDKPNESYTVDGLNKYGATIKASDITITNTTYNGIDAYGVFDLNAANDISIQGATNGIFTPTDHENSSITIKTPKKLTITGPWAIHAEGKGTITIDAGDLVLRGSNGIAANSTGTVSIDAQTVDIASTNKYGVSSANTGGVTIKAEKSIYIKGGSANAVNGLQGAITHTRWMLAGSKYSSLTRSSITARARSSLGTSAVIRRVGAMELPERTKSSSSKISRTAPSMRETVATLRPSAEAVLVKECVRERRSRNSICSPERPDPRPFMIVLTPKA